MLIPFDFAQAGSSQEKAGTRRPANKLDQRGWMSENHPFLQHREKCFLLTSPFIATVWKAIHLARLREGAAIRIITCLRTWTASRRVAPWSTVAGRAWHRSLLSSFGVFAELCARRFREIKRVAFTLRAPCRVDGLFAVRACACGCKRVIHSRSIE